MTSTWAGRVGLWLAAGAIAFAPALAQTRPARHHRQTAAASSRHTIPATGEPYNALLEEFMRACEDGRR